MHDSCKSHISLLTAGVLREAQYLSLAAYMGQWTTDYAAVSDVAETGMVQ